MDENQQLQLPVAIIGIGCIFAKSPDLKAFFHLLIRGVSGISDPPATHQHLVDYFDPDPKKPDHIYCNRGGFLPTVQFDPTEFNIPPNVIEATDTSQLLGLMTAKRALEDAGYGDKGKSFDRSRASVILGVTGTQELVIPLGARLGHPLWKRALAESGVPADQAESVIRRISDGYVGWQENSFPGLLGNVVAGRIANRLDLGGTNCVVDAACASSMGAIHMAMLELTSGRSDMVLTGGVDTINDAFMHMCFSKTQILSATGDIRPFSKNADGTVLGEGIGLLVLKRLDDAEKDGDRIYAVIKGLGSASDGRSQSIYAPRPEGQARALRRAYQAAGADPANVGLVEAHGTGTRVGDGVEFQALCDVFGEISPNGNRCALGSVKSNIGHTKAAAGSAGLIKTALSIYHKVLPPTLKADSVDPKLGVEHSPFYINTQLRPWVSPNGRKRSAGVSAFGFGGSNFHAVMEEYAPSKLEPSWDGTVEIVAFSGPDEQDVAAKIKRWSQQAGKNPSRYTIGKMAKHSRRLFNFTDHLRLAMVLRLDDHGDNIADNCKKAIKQLNGEDVSSDGATFIGRGPKKGRLAFLFPGQGSQYVGMGRDLICCLPESLEAFESAVDGLKSQMALDECVYPRMPADAEHHSASLRQTHIAQPAIGAVSVAMLRALEHFGLTPDMTCGHSYGELVALHAAGWLSQNDLWQLSADRGRLMAAAGASAAETGTMLAVMASMNEIEELIQSLDCHDQVVLANKNSPHQGVLSGTMAAIQAAEQACKAKNWPTVRLPVAAAFHSHLVAEAQKPFEARLRSVAFSPGTIGVMSNTLGGAYPKDMHAVQDTLGRHLARPVDFLSNVQALYQQGIRTFIEVGPKNVLSELVRSTLNGRDIHVIALDQSKGRGSGIFDLACALTRLSCLGSNVRLDRWEKSQSQTRKARMAISLSGTNYRNPQPDKAKEARRPISETPEQSIPSTPVHQQAPDAEHRTSAARMPVSSKQFTQPDLKMKMANNTTAALQSALTAVQQGLASLQALQNQTAQTHQKFLETQAEASRTLQMMIQSTQQLAASAMGGPAMDPPVLQAAKTPANALGAEKIASQPTPQSDSENSQPHSGVIRQASAEPSEAVVGSPKNNASSDIQAGLLSVVSQLTGYPVEMLGLEMDIESDLGIDSIKRVEILSAMEEKMPHLPQVTPDMMGTLKTLGQICEYLTGDDNFASRPQLHEDPPTTEPPQNVKADEIQNRLIVIVSQLTGYPVEMLGLEMDIESDLGIDSIKRVEILSALEEQMPDLPKVTPDMMGTLKTLGQILSYLNNPGANSAADAIQPIPAGEHRPKADDDRLLSGASTIDRQIVQAVPCAPPSGNPMTLPTNHFIGIAGGRQDLSVQLIKSLSRRGLAAKHVSAPEKLVADMPMTGIVLLAPIDPEEAFRWAQASASVLENTAAAAPACFITVSCLDGAFGFNGGEIADPFQGALAGLAKTAAIEWPTVRCLALDCDPAWQDLTSVAETLADEISMAQNHRETEIGLGRDRRVRLHLSSAAVPKAEKIKLTARDVVIITGGARGVTAEAAKALAAHTSCTMALIGRSPLPQPEPDWLPAHNDEAQIKKAILSRQFAGQKPAPREIERQYRYWTANRQIQTNLDALRTLGADAQYYSVDVNDAPGVLDTVKRIQRDLGPVRAVIHGAGVLEDRLIVDKRLDQFNKVYNTKVAGLLNLLAGLDGTDLDYLVLFSSVTARIGNQGQVDYAMANEVLNKVARQQSRLRPHCKVISINWGPWDGGMVTPALKRNFLKNKVALIPTDQGTSALLAEMADTSSPAIEVVIGGLIGRTGTQDRPEPPSTAPAALSLTCKREVDVTHHPVLRSHLLDGRPVVPLALIAEWLAHSALHANPGLSLHGMDNLRLFNGIALDNQKRSIRMLAGKACRNGQVYEVDVEIRNDQSDGLDRVHSSARAILTDRLPTAPPFEENGHFKSNGRTPPSMADIYRSVLFHGRDLRGIQEIIRISETGISARLASAPPPAQWMKAPLRSRWIADPLILDCAFQMAIIWCHDQLGQVSLPSYAASYRQYCDRFPRDGVRAVLEVRSNDARKLKGDFTFLDAHKRVLAHLSGYEAIMAPDLVKAFKAA